MITSLNRQQLSNAQGDTDIGIVSFVLCKHNSILPWHFSSCDQSFLRRDCLRSHIDQVHENNYPFLCPQCGFKARKKGALRKHIEKVHEGIKPIPTAKQICSTCGASVANLKLHIDTVHEGKKPHECNICEYRSATKGCLI